MSTDRGHWTPLPVAERLAEAADALERLPQGGVQGYASRLRWPYADDGRSGARLPSPSPEAIDRMDEALGWLMWLEPEERRLVWLRAQGTALEADHASARDRPDHGVAAVDYGAAQDLGPAERSRRTKAPEQQDAEHTSRFCATRHVTSDEVREPEMIGLCR